MDLPPELEILRSARSVAFGPHGFFQAQSADTVAYQRVLGERSASGPQLAWLLEHAEAGGRIYAACLLRAIDANAGGEALRGLLRDGAALRFCVAGSCALVPTTVAECARWLLAETPAKAAPEAVLMSDEEVERQARLRAEELRRLEQLRQLNRRTAEMVEASGGQPACPHCAVRAAHRIVVAPQSDVGTYLVCSGCHRSFDGGDAAV